VAAKSSGNCPFGISLVWARGTTVRTGDDCWSLLCVGDQMEHLGFTAADFVCGCRRLGNPDTDNDSKFCIPVI
jgi:hypothetical protein